MRVTPEQVHQIMSTAKVELIADYFPFLTAAMQEFEITTYLRAAAFLAQLAHESGELRYMQEIASGSAYEGRKDLGNVHPGDGKRYKGRGPIQLTGRANYKKYGELLGVDLINNPTIAATPEVGFRIAGLFWKLNGLNELADRGKFETITRRINGGLNGYPDRVHYYKRALNVLSDEPAIEIPGQPHPPSPPAPDTQPSRPVHLDPSAVAVAPVSQSLMSRVTAIGTQVTGALTMLGLTTREVLSGAGVFARANTGLAVVFLSAVALIALGVWYQKHSKQRAHEKTMEVMRAAANPEGNKVRIV